MKRALAVLSGGLDSSTAVRLLVEKLGADNVQAITFKYGQRNFPEINCAQIVAEEVLGIKWHLFDLSQFSKLTEGFTSLTDMQMQIPTIQESIGDPQPSSYVPNRNMVFLSIAAALAEVQRLDTLVVGFQLQDEYTVHDTSGPFVDRLNEALAMNRKFKVRIEAPFGKMRKEDEIKAIYELDGNVDFFANTHTCYDPTYVYGKRHMCGICSTCADRIQGFINAGHVDPLPYVREIDWRKNG